MNKKISTIAGTIILLTITAILSVYFLLEPVKTATIQNENNVFLDNSMPEIIEPQIDINTEHKPLDNIATVELKSTEVKSTDISETFQANKEAGYFGTLTITGYLDIKHRICEEGDMCNKTVEYASFIITSTNNNQIYDFINSYAGNSFVNNNSIGIGCYEKNNKRIYSSNVGDDGNFENIITGSDLKKILRSNSSNLVTIQLSKPYYTGGSGAPECYSHFRLFKILEK